MSFSLQTSQLIFGFSVCILISTSSPISTPILCSPPNIIETENPSKKLSAKVEYSNLLDIESMVLTLFRGGHFYFHNVSSMFTYHFNKRNEVWAYVEDVKTTIHGYRPYFDFSNMMLYDLQCIPSRAYKIDYEYFEDFD